MASNTVAPNREAQFNTMNCGRVAEHEIGKIGPVSRKYKIALAAFCAINALAIVAVLIFGVPRI
jgi:hypothetical protein